MPLRYKAILIVTLSLGTLFGALWFTLSSVIEENFLKLERSQMITDLARVKGALERELSGLDSKVADWSNWDDSYQFVLDGNKPFIQSNISYGALKALGIHYMGFFGLKGEPVFVGYRLDESEEIGAPPVEVSKAVSQQLEEVFKTDPLLMTHRTGLIVSRQGGPTGKLLLFVAKPILNSEFSGPARGIIVFARTIDEALITDLTKQLHLSLSIKVVTSNDTNQILFPNSRIEPSGASLVSGSTVLPTLTNSVGVLLHVDSPRPIHNQGIAVRRLIIVLLLSGVIVGCVVVWTFTDRVIVRRVSDLQTTVSSITDSSDLSQRLNVKGCDELSLLAKNMNLMFEQLQHSNEALERLRSEAETANAAKNTFLANVSHEIRTPLNGVIGLTELLIDTPLNAEQHEFASTIHESGKTLLTIINDILDVSKAEAGKLELDKTDFVLRELFESCTRLFSPLANQRHITFTIEYATELPRFVIGDAQRFHQVLTNLLGNALKFTPSGGAIWLLVSHQENVEEKIILEVSVCDSGIGIPPEKHADIFEGFVQGDASTSRRYGGTGLGLSIARSLIELMSGTIELASIPGVGSRFTVRLPLQVSHQVSAQPSNLERVAPAHAFAQSATILVVEDNPVNQMLLKKMLLRRGYQVLVADDGSQAVEACRSKQFSLVFMDCQMPVMDGYTATATIRTTLAQTGLPIIALTANAMPGERERCLAAGMNDFMTKPIDKIELDRLLGSYCKFERPLDQEPEPSSTPLGNT